MPSIEVFRNDPNVRAFAAGETLIADGAAPGDEMYVLVSGEAEVVAHGRVLETLGPGGIFGEMALVDSSPRSAAVIGKAAGQVAPISRKRFEYLVANTPFFALEVMQVMAQRLRHMNEGA